MASLLRLSLSTAIVLLFLTASSTARPCRPLLISSFTFRNPSSHTVTILTSYRSLSSPPLHHTTVDHDDDDDDDNLDGMSTIEIIDKHPLHRFFLPEFHFVPRASLPRAQLGFSSSTPTSTTSSFAFASLRDRTKDILSVVLALLFGVGCGAITAGAMYLVWSTFSGRRDYRFDDLFDSDDDDDNEIETPKKLGYEKLPAAEAAALPPPAKDVV